MRREHEGNPKSAKPATDRLEMMLEIEELEPIVAPGIYQNSNETLVTDPEGE